MIALFLASLSADILNLLIGILIKRLVSRGLIYKSSFTKLFGNE